jgi:heme exporter protein C
MLLVIAYFVLRASIDDAERRAVYGSVFAIIAFADAPISLLITRLVPSSVHPVIFRTDSGLQPSMLLPFLMSLFGMTLVAYGLYHFRLREQNLKTRLATLKATIEN